MRPPRAVLIRMASGFILASSAAPMKFSVSGVRGRWREMTSHSAKISSGAARVMPWALAYASSQKGSWASTFMPKPWARWATLRPMAPRPRMPMVPPVTSRVVIFFQSPWRQCWSMSTVLRATARSRAMA
mgnify:CR=1 FL=1|jgi:hypothetical protein